MAERRGLIRVATFPRTTGGFREIAAAAVDPDFANVVLLLDWAGSDGGTSTVDLSDSVHTLTFLGDTDIDTSNKYLDVNSIDNKNGTSDDVRVEGSRSDFDFGTADFTVELGVYAASVATMALIGFTYDAGFYIGLNSGNIDIVDTPSFTARFSEAWVPNTGTWYHVAIVRDSGVLRIFIDGTQLGSGTAYATDLGFDSGNDSFIGSFDPTNQEWRGNIGAVRITKGIARYTANFTAPTEFYPTS